MFEDVESPSIGAYGVSSSSTDADDVVATRMSSSAGQAMQRQQRGDYSQQQMQIPAQKSEAEPISKDWLMYYMLHNIGNM